MDRSSRVGFHDTTITNNFAFSTHHLIGLVLLDMIRSDEMHLLQYLQIILRQKIADLWEGLNFFWIVQTFLCTATDTSAGSKLSLEHFLQRAVDRTQHNKKIIWHIWVKVQYKMCHNICYTLSITISHKWCDCVLQLGWGPQICEIFLPNLQLAAFFCRHYALNCPIILGEGARFLSIQVKEVT